MSSSGPPARLLGQAFERCAVEERLPRSSLHYALTGLPTRALFIDRVERALRRGLAEDTAAVLVVGLDRFAGVNNVLGQDAGGAILREVWPGLKEQLAATDTLARVAAEEFAILRIRPLVAGEFSRRS